jgi:hypothetical protein
MGGEFLTVSVEGFVFVYNLMCMNKYNLKRTEKHQEDIANK